MSEETKSPASYATPIAIILAGVVIAGAIFYGEVQEPKSAKTNILANQVLIDNFEPVTKTDNIAGNPNGELTIIEYSDLECPFCKVFHLTMNDLIAERSDIRWVYRHFPLSELHAKATTEAVASECARVQGGNNIFWQYIDQIFTITTSNDGLDLAILPEIASTLGLDVTAFNTCLTEEQTLTKVLSDYDDAIAIGADGTPFVIATYKDGTPIAIFKAMQDGSINEADPVIQDLASDINRLYVKNIEALSGQ